LWLIAHSSLGVFNFLADSYSVYASSALAGMLNANGSPVPRHANSRPVYTSFGQVNLACVILSEELSHFSQGSYTTI
jgi:hypothetical protein